MRVLAGVPESKSTTWPADRILLKKNVLNFAFVLVE